MHPFSEGLPCTPSICGKFRAEPSSMPGPMLIPDPFLPAGASPAAGPRPVADPGPVPGGTEGRRPRHSVRCHAADRRAVRRGPGPQTPGGTAAPGSQRGQLGEWIFNIFLL
ncbi:hypothetical protein CEXT_353961 [Caerostris extrusa]|uniref:Uncharacterized protein n=1 Tax=Caerostris extrusa TaxID=172846 RepID=A0AAV4NJB0_CAEEX|nr:hypothetical protein CEXT_353961 [Caerostris extrusa]